MYTKVTVWKQQMYSPTPTTSMKCPSTLLVVKDCNVFVVYVWQLWIREATSV